MKKQKGITLIALVITIIVLLILAGISIAILAGENGLLTKANKAEEEIKKATYKEVLELLGAEIRPEKILENLGTKEFMDRYQGKIEEEIKGGDILKGATLKRKNEETIYVITKEGWGYKITENKVEFLGKKGENPPPDLREANITWNLIPNGWTNQNITVKIIVIGIEMKDFILQYSKDGKDWSDYKEPFIVEENGTIYARLINQLDEIGGTATKNIDKIDRTPPTIKLTVNDEEITHNSARLRATVEDTQSGYTASYQYYLNGSFRATGNGLSYTFENLKPKTQYTLKFWVKDRAGNPAEESITITTKEPIIEKGVIYKEKTVANDDYGNKVTIPGGFKIPDDSATNVAEGIVIEDATNTSTKGNQFVWIPVGTIKTSTTETKNIVLNRYKFDSNGVPIAVGEEGVATTNSNNWVKAYEYVNPNYDVRPAKNLAGFKSSVENNKGYYLGRYEAGDTSAKNYEQSGRTFTNIPVCRQSVFPYNWVYQAEASNLSKKMYPESDTSLDVTSDLINSYSWDTALEYIYQCAEDKSYASKTHRTFGGGVHKTGESSGSDYPVDVICNIYDMASNYIEYSTETSTDANWCRTLRGAGGGNSNYTTGARHTNAIPYSSRSREYAFRPILYFKN